MQKTYFNDERYRFVACLVQCSCRATSVVYAEFYPHSYEIGVFYCPACGNRLDTAEVAQLKFEAVQDIADKIINHCEADYE